MRISDFSLATLKKSKELGFDNSLIETCYTAKLVYDTAKKNRIDAKCIECKFVPWEGEKWEDQVKDCTFSDCPLYPIRKGAS